MFWKERLTQISDLKSNFRFLASRKIVGVLRNEEPGTSVTNSLLMFMKWLVEKHGFNYSCVIFISITVSQACLWLGHLWPGVRIRVTINLTECNPTPSINFFREYNCQGGLI